MGGLQAICACASENICCPRKLSFFFPIPRSVNAADVVVVMVDAGPEKLLRCSKCALVVTADPSLSPSLGPSLCLGISPNKSERDLFSPREDSLRTGRSPGAIVPSHALTSLSSSSLSLSIAVFLSSTRRELSMMWSSIEASEPKHGARKFFANAPKLPLGLANEPVFVWSKNDKFFKLFWRSKSDIDPKDPPIDTAEGNPFRLLFRSRTSEPAPAGRADLLCVIADLLVLTASAWRCPNNRLRPWAESFRSFIVRGALVLAGSDCDNLLKLKESFLEYEFGSLVPAI